jgi:hypothetical protein
MISETINNYFTGDRHYRIYDDVTEALEACQYQPRQTDAWLDPRKVGERFGSWDEVLLKTNEANPEMLKVVEQMVEELEDTDIPEPVDHRRRMVFTEDNGDEIDIDRQRSGQPYWRTMKRMATVGTQVKTIVIQMGAQRGYSAKDLQWRGVVAIVLTHLLEAVGYQVEIWAVHTCNKAYVDGSGHINAIRLKDAYGALDADTISTVLSGWFLRSIWFALKERDNLSLAETYGEPRSMYWGEFEYIAPGIDEDNNDDLIYIHHCFSQFRAKAILEHELGKYAEPIEEDWHDDVEATETEEGEGSTQEEAPKETAAERRRREKREKEWEREYKKRNREN